MENKEVKAFAKGKTLTSIANMVAEFNATMKSQGMDTRVSLTVNKERKEFHTLKKTGATVLNQLGFTVRFNGTDNGLEVSVEKFSSFKFNVQPNANGGNTVSALYKGKRMTSLMNSKETETASFDTLMGTYKALDGFVKGTLKMEERNLAAMIEEYKFLIAKRLFNALEYVGMDVEDLA